MRSFPCPSIHENTILLDRVVHTACSGSITRPRSAKSSTASFRSYLQKKRVAPTRCAQHYHSPSTKSGGLEDNEDHKNLCGSISPRRPLFKAIALLDTKVFEDRAMLTTKVKVVIILPSMLTYAQSQGRQSSSCGRDQGLQSSSWAQVPRLQRGHVFFCLCWVNKHYVCFLSLRRICSRFHLTLECRVL